MGWGAAIAAGLSIAGSVAGSSGGLSRRTIRHRGHGAIDRFIQPRINTLFGAQEMALQRSKATRKEGYDAALKETSGIGRAGRRRILEREKSTIAGAEQDYTSRGLSGNSARTAYR